MIGSFSETETERIWNGLRSRKLSPDIQKRALDKLKLIDAATKLEPRPTARKCGGWSMATGAVSQAIAARLSCAGGVNWTSDTACPIATDRLTLRAKPRA